MFESNQGFGESWEGSSSTFSRELPHVSANDGIAHAPLILPHLSADIPAVIDYEGSLIKSLEICEHLEERGLLTQADLDAGDNLSDVIETTFNSLFSGLNLDEVTINMEEVRSYQKGKRDKVKVVVEAFHYELGAYSIEAAIKYLNEQEAGLGECFSRLVCTAVGILYRGWTPFNAWHHVTTRDWRFCDTYEQFAEEILEEMDGDEEELMHMNVIKTQEAIDGLGGNFTAFHIDDREKVAFVQEMRGKLNLFGKYKELVEAMLLVLTEVTFGIEQFAEQYRSCVEEDGENGFGYGEIAIYAVENSVFDHLYDQHMQSLYEVGIDENAVSFGWMLDGISKTDVDDMVRKLKFLQEKRAWFADVLNNSLQKDSWN
ncbi:MAG: hypothetical protein ACTS9Y_01070 [Methylophilus sp.]|uniref:hypothetical protein n=1 Tax=Methylophilus sp. TaxID=29541 RepID=UPI003F9F9EF7